MIKTGEFRSYTYLLVIKNGKYKIERIIYLGTYQCTGSHVTTQKPKRGNRLHDLRRKLSNLKWNTV